MPLVTLLLGIAGGFVLSIPPGPLSIAVTREGLEGYLKHAMMIVLGAAIMDIVYILIATFASSAIVLALQQLIKETEWFPVLFQIACIIVLLYLGIRYLTPARCEEAATKNEMAEKQQVERAQKMGHASPFFIGLLIAITNLASPTFIPSMITFVGFLHANGWLQRGALSSTLFSVGFGLGTVLWFFSMLRILHRFRHTLPKNFVLGVYRFAGGTLILFAAVIAYHTVTATQWAHLM
jgi:threonine/homoserine/homoserine lactone efflux protein